jgi:uncharacterized protein
MTKKSLTREEAIRRLLAAEAEIRRFGVRRLALFGSIVRGEASPDSDVDFLVEFEPARKTFDHFVGLALYLEGLMDRRVDIVTPEFLSPYIGPHILREAEDVLRVA